MKQTFSTKQYDAQPFIDGQRGEGKAELLPCPFCGAHGGRELSKAVGCINCGARGPKETYSAQKINRWNTRAPELLSQLTAAKEENERLKKEQTSPIYDYHDGGKVNVHPQYIDGFNDGYKAAKAEADALRREVAELNERGKNLTRDFNNAKKMLNQYMQAIQDLKEENAKLKNYE